MFKHYSAPLLASVVPLVCGVDVTELAMYPGFFHIIIHKLNFKLQKIFLPFVNLSLLLHLLQVTSHPEPVSQSMSLPQPPQSQYSMPDRDKQLLFSEFEDLSASFRSLYKSVFEQSFSQQGEWPHGSIKWKPNRA